MITFIRQAGNARISLLEYFLPSLSERYGEVEQPQYQYAKALNIDFTNTPINIGDLARFSLYSNLHTLCLRKSNLTDEHIEIAAMLGHYVKTLDIRDNPKITTEGLELAIGCTLCRQAYRRILGFSQLKELIFDARPDLILDENLFLKLQLPKNRKLQIYGELQNQDILSEAFQHEFVIINSSKNPQNLKVDVTSVHSHDQSQTTSELESTYFPEKNSEDKYAVLKKYYSSCDGTKGVLGQLQLPENRTIQIYAELQTKRLKNKTIQHEIAYNHCLIPPPSSKDQSPIVSYHDKNEVLMTTRGLYLPEKFSENEYTSLKNYFISGQKVYERGLVNIFYHHQNDILFTQQGVYFPEKFVADKYFSLKQYFIICQRIDQRTHPAESMVEGEKNITSIMQTQGLQDDFSLLATDFRYAYTDKTITEMEPYGWLSEIRKIEALTACNFLKSIKIVVTDNARF